MVSTASMDFPHIPGYSIFEPLYTGSKTAVYRALKAPQQEQVVIKLLQREYPSFSELVQFRNQYTIAKNLTIPGIVKPLSLEPWRNSFALVMEDVGGLSLKQYIEAECLLDSLEVLVIAQQLADILHELIQDRVVHKDIKPANILICPQSKQIQLIDFSIASLLPKETQELKNPNVLEGTLAYLAPEQTGRMNRGIDYRTDFYGLGATLYELLTGQLPFPCDDPLELVHCHIAKPPIPPHQINPNIPPMVSAIVLKLMAKNAEDRYQSALGLKYDLENCLSQSKETGTVTEFQLAQRDVSDRFVIPEKLYGREGEVQQLLAAFERVAEGKTELMLVAGFSGIGKTAVVNEVDKPIVRKRGYFIKGKFDQFNRNLPFSALVQALGDLMGQLLGESDAQLKQWKEKILDAVGNNGQVIIEVIPELERIIGQQPAVPELSGSAAQNRFNLLFSKFIQVFTTKEHPLVIFLDDLQWADSASLHLMKSLISEREKGYLLLTGAYRDNEVFPAHPLMLTLDKIEKQEGTINTITLSPLSHENINQLVAETVICTSQLAQPLTELVYQKTKGNPFFTTQFMLGLYGEELIKFNFDLGYWECDLAEVRQRALTDDVVEFMAGRLQKLPTETQEVLKLAACIGNQFDLETLAIVCEESKEETADRLWRALQEGFILPQSDVYKFYLGERSSGSQERNSQVVNYKFLHDRVQQAAYFLIPEAEKARVHYRIGRLLLENIVPEEEEESIFELVGQLNYGIDEISKPEEKEELARLNLIACRKAKSATAYLAGREYAGKGLSLLSKNPWQEQYEITLALSELAAEFAALCGDLEEMERLVAEVVANSRFLWERANVYRLQIQANNSRQQLAEAISVALGFLQELGVTFPENPTEADVATAVTTVQELMRDREVEDLLNLPEMKDEETIAIVQTANSIFSSTYTCNSLLFPVLVCLCVSLSIQYGNIPASSFAYVCYGLIISSGTTPDIITGGKFGQLALQLVDKLAAQTAKPEVLLMAGVFILHRTSHLQETLPFLQAGYTSGLETGNYEFAGHSGHSFCGYSLWCSRPLETLLEETRTYCRGLEEINQSFTAHYTRIYWQAMLNLLGQAENPTVLSGEALPESEAVLQWQAANDVTGLSYFHTWKLMLCYLFGDIKSALIQIDAGRQYTLGTTGTIYVPALHFYAALSTLAELQPASENCAEVFQQVEADLSVLQHWADYAPMNHQHKCDLIQAEKCRVLGQKLEAIELYDKAITGAKANEYLQEEALANELAAKFYLNWGLDPSRASGHRSAQPNGYADDNLCNSSAQPNSKEKVAAGYMQEAYYCYARWGAKAKTDDLEQRYPNLLRPILKQTEQTLNPLETLVTLSQSSLSIHHSISTSHSSTSSTTSINNTLDFAAVLKASQALSGMIELDQLLRQLTQMILQNSGSDRCALILPNHNKEWSVRAIATLEETELCSQPLENYPNVPIKLIQYVKNTQEAVVVDDLKTDLPVIGEYLLQKQPKSVLCLPILNQGNLIGILYLKNQSTRGAFTRERILVLNFLCTQAAISLENARLYQQAQNYAQQLEQSQLQLVQSEKMSALGNLVAGVAHEINNPLGFVGGNIKELQTSLQDITEYLQLYQSTFPSPGNEIEEKREELEIEFLLEDIPKMLDSLKVGCDRIGSISTSLRMFSRADTESKFKANVHDGIDSTLLILKYRLNATEIRSEIEVIRNYGDLPEINCFPGQLNQVFMNLLANAIDMFDEIADGHSFNELQANPQQITICTNLVKPHIAEIRISDNGKGMSEAVCSKIFDQKFTTKAVGKGTGLGLAIARQIIVEKHGGSLEVDSFLGQGTQFYIRLPIL